MLLVHFLTSSSTVLATLADGSSGTAPNWVRTGTNVLGTNLDAGRENALSYIYGIGRINGSVAEISISIPWWVDETPPPKPKNTFATFLVDVNTRVCLNDGRYFDLWIPTNVSVGDVVYTSLEFLSPYGVAMYERNYPFEVRRVVDLYGRRAFELVYEYGESRVFYAYYDYELGLKLLSYVEFPSRGERMYHFMHTITEGDGVILDFNIYAMVFGTTAPSLSVTQTLLALAVVAALAARIRYGKIARAMQAF